MPRVAGQVQEMISGMSKRSQKANRIAQFMPTLTIKGTMYGLESVKEVRSTYWSYEGKGTPKIMTSFVAEYVGVTAQGLDYITRINWIVTTRWP